VSIDGVHSHPLAAASLQQFGANGPRSAGPTGPFIEVHQVRDSVSPPVSNSPPASRTAGGTSGGSTSPANPLQSLASDIQAMLIQAQNTSGQGGVPGGTTAAATPVRSVAADLRAVVGNIQSAVAPNSQTANSNPTGPAGAAEHHHHRHHHGGGGEAIGTFDVGASTGSSSNGGSGTGTQTADNQSVFTISATDIMQAIRAYTGGTTPAAAPALKA
jgi:hypothetical protein